MKVREIKDKLGLKLICGEVSLDKEVGGCYCCDLLSWVMSRANSSDAWLTVMGNVNCVGVAVLADISCIILTEGSDFDDDALEKAIKNDVVVLQSEKNTYQTAVLISKLLGD
ncbi:MAG TPA: DRTGG domain-containing protein [Clostridia bacterium]|nr:DRTGG domain-containing protein [Clostridia bacterium]